MARRFALIAALSLLSANAVFDTAWAQAESVSERPDGAAVDRKFDRQGVDGENGFRHHDRPF